MLPLPSLRSAPDAPLELLDVLTIALVATVCGAEDCAGFAAFAAARAPLLRSLFRDPTLPSPASFARILALLDPPRFGRAFERFLDHLGRDGDGVLAIDAETLRRSFERARAGSALHAKIAFGPSARVAVAERRHGAQNGGILESLTLDGVLVIGDAAGAALARQILDRGGRYLLALSPSRPATLRAAERFFAGRTPESGGQIISDDTGWLTPEEPAPPGLVSVACIESPAAPARRYFLSSTPLTVASLAHALRGRCSIASPQCWVLDLAADRGHCGTEEAIATLDRLALDVLRKARPRLPLARKRQRAIRSDTFARTIIGQMR